MDRMQEVRSTPVPTAILEPTLTSSKTNPDDIQLRDPARTSIAKSVITPASSFFTAVIDEQITIHASTARGLWELDQDALGLDVGG